MHRIRIEQAIVRLRGSKRPGPAVVAAIALTVVVVPLLIVFDWVMVLGATAVLGTIAALLWWIPQRHIAPWKQQVDPETRLAPGDLLQAETATRSTLAQLLGGLAVLVGLFFSWQQIQDTRRESLTTQRLTEQTQRLTEQGQITDRFTRAVDQLGSPERQVRIGGVYALERIARDSPPDAGPVMEVLTAFVRERAPWTAGMATPPATEPSLVGLPPTPPADVQAVLTVIGRGQWDVWWPDADMGTPGPGGMLCLNLGGADLRGGRLRGDNLPPLCLGESSLAGANLTDADLAGAYLAFADLTGAHLAGADLHDAYMPRADLTGAELQQADLSGAYLGDANLTGARLDGANLEGVILDGANLAGADLDGSRNLTQSQLDAARVDADTRIPPGLSLPSALRHDSTANLDGDPRASGLLAVHGDRGAPAFGHPGIAPSSSAGMPT